MSSIFAFKYGALLSAYLNWFCRAIWVGYPNILWNEHKHIHVIINWQLSAFIFKMVLFLCYEKKTWSSFVSAMTAMRGEEFLVWMSDDKSSKLYIW